MSTPNGTVTRRELHAQYAAAHAFGAADWRALGTSAHLVVTAAHQLVVAEHAVVDVLDRIDRAASRFRDDSELSRVNHADGEWVEISPLLTRALRVAVDAAAWTDGLVDPTIGAALFDLGYDRTFRLIESDGAALTVPVRAVPGWQQVELDDENRRVRAPAGTLLDLGATAKGLAADLAATAAADAAGCGVLVSLGGDIAVAGPAPSDGWAVTVADTSDLTRPAGSEAEQTIRIRAGGLATSSVRARRWRRGGSEIHHLIDPRTAGPAREHWRTATVAASTCTLANAASTASILLGPVAPRWLTERRLAARLVRSDGDVTRVAGWPAPGDDPAGSAA